MDTYKATNTTNGRFYIGSTTNFERRKTEHLKCEKNYPFQNALRKNPENFEWELWSDDSDEPILEQALLDMWFGKECCYNLNPSAQHPPSWQGKEHAPETKKKQSESALSRWEHMPEEQREQFSIRMKGENNPATRPDVRVKISESRQGKCLGDLNPSKRPEVKEKIAESKRGKPNPDTRLRNLRDNPAKRKEVREKMSLANLGKKHWINEQGERKYQAESPGPEWQNGRTWKG
jgi:group I intron endonuclease